MLRERRSHETYFTVSGDLRYQHEHIRLRTIDAPWYVLPDHLGRFLMPYEFLSTPYDLLGDLGHTKDLGSDRTYVGYPPRSITHGRLESINSWDTYVSNVRHLFTDWSFTNGTLPGNLDENPISHFNLVGVVTSEPTPDKFDRKSDGQGGYTNYYIDGWPLYNLTLAGSNDAFHLERYGNDLTFYPPGLLLEMALKTKVDVANGSWDFYYDGILYYYDSFEVEYQGLSVKRISYRVSTRGISPWYWRQKVHRVKYEYTFARSPSYLDFNQGVPLNSYVVPHCLRSSCVTGYSEMFDPSTYPVFYENLSIPALNSDYSSYEEAVVTDLATTAYFTHPGLNSSRVSELIGANPDGSYYQTSHRSFLDFKVSASYVLPECFPAVFFSTKNAVDEYFVRMKANHIEALAELGDFLKVLDTVRLAYSLRKSPSVSTFWKLLKLLANAKLTYSLGIAPTVSDAKDIAKKVPSLTQRFLNLTKEETLYGNFTYTIPERWFPEFGEVRLVAHSKIRISVLPDSYLTALLPIRSLGLLPTLSAMWDLVPFSFVVDWFLKLGDNQDDLETSAMLLAMQCYTSVHSVLIKYDFDEMDQSDYDFSVDLSAPRFAGYQYYDRFLLGGLPTVGPSKLPFHGEASVPDWGTFTSLIYQLISGK